jgi:hypothetical protein
MTSAIFESRHLSDRLITIIQNNAEELTRSTVLKLQTSPRTKSYHKLSRGELHDRIYEVYHNLGRWLWRKSEEEIRSWHMELGQKRRGEGIPLDEVLWAQVLTKYRLLDYLAAYASADSAMGLYQQQEFDRLIGQFFDRALCYTAEGYEQEKPHRPDASPKRPEPRSLVHWRFP